MVNQTIQTRTLAGRTEKLDKISDEWIAALKPPLEVVDERLVSTFWSLRNDTQYYHRSYQTIFTAPFTGEGYFMAAWDDFNDFWFTKLDEDGNDLEMKKLYSSWWQSCASPHLSHADSNAAYFYLHFRRLHSRRRKQNKLLIFFLFAHYFPPKHMQ
jgi:hypothetical protein